MITHTTSTALSPARKGRDSLEEHAVLRSDGLRWRAWVIVLFNSAVALWLLLSPSGARQATAVSDVAQVAGPLLAVLLCFADRSLVRRLVTTKARTSILLVAGVLSFAIGQLIWSYEELVMHRAVPVPSLADVGFLSAYPLILLALLGLPGRRVSPVRRTQVAFDGLMIMVAVATCSWAFILGPLLIEGAGSTIEKIFIAACPIGDLLLICCLLLLTQRSGDRKRRLVLGVLGGALVSIVATDTHFMLATLRGSYLSGAVSDVGWSLGYMLVALAARAIAIDTPEEATALGVAADDDDRVAPLARQLLPFVAVPLVAALMLWSLNTLADMREVYGVAVGGAVLLGLVLARQVLAIVENARLNRVLQSMNERLVYLAGTDPVTDLPNHRSLVATIDAELADAPQIPVALLFVDLDHFKALNDSYGHEMGDTALREFGALVQRILPAEAVVGRWGGEEFVVVALGMNASGANALAEQVRTVVAAHVFTAANVKLTCSLGVAIAPIDGATRDHLIMQADRRMYHAKSQGRNRVSGTSLETNSPPS